MRLLTGLRLGKLISVDCRPIHGAMLIVHFACLPQTASMAPIPNGLISDETGHRAADANGYNMGIRSILLNEIAGMNSDRITSPRATFIICATVSAIATGLSPLFPGAGVILPGVFFGIAIAYAINRKIEPLRPISRVLLIALSIFGYWIACVTGAVTVRLYGGENGFMAGAVIGAAAGGAGASFVAAGVAIASNYFQSMRVFVVTTLAGTTYGAVFMIASVWLRDFIHAPDSLVLVISFLIWQVGVASAIPLPRKLDVMDAC